MNKITPQNIALFNANLRYESPEEIIKFVSDIAEKPIATTSFGPLSASLLHACICVNPDLPIIWCDTGYNTAATYQHLEILTEKLRLNLDIFAPKYTTAFLDHTLGRPDVDSDHHSQFSEKVKLEPFRRALKKHQPDVWLTNLRKDQSEHRKSLDILSFSQDGILKVSPFYYFSDAQLIQYLKINDLPFHSDYNDPVKALEKRECGIHLTT